METDTQTSPAPAEPQTLTAQTPLTFSSGLPYLNPEERQQVTADLHTTSSQLILSPTAAGQQTADYTAATHPRMAAYGNAVNNDATFATAENLTRARWLAALDTLNSNNGMDTESVKKLMTAAIAVNNDAVYAQSADPDTAKAADAAEINDICDTLLAMSNNKLTGEMQKIMDTLQRNGKIATAAQMQMQYKHGAEYRRALRTVTDENGKTVKQYDQDTLVRFAHFYMKDPELEKQFLAEKGYTDSKQGTPQERHAWYYKKGGIYEQKASAYAQGMQDYLMHDTLRAIALARAQNGGKLDYGKTAAIMQEHMNPARLSQIADLSTTEYGDWQKAQQDSDTAFARAAATKFREARATLNVQKETAAKAEADAKAAEERSKKEQAAINTITDGIARDKIQADYLESNPAVAREKAEQEARLKNAQDTAKRERDAATPWRTKLARPTSLTRKAKEGDEKRPIVRVPAADYEAICQQHGIKAGQGVYCQLGGGASAKEYVVEPDAEAKGIELNYAAWAGYHKITPATKKATRKTKRENYPINTQFIVK